MGFSLALSHFGLYVTDLARMLDFYTRFMGFAVSDRGAWQGGEIVFLTRDPREHHQLVLVSGRPPAPGFNVVNQLSFRVDSLATLREMRRGLEREAVTGIGSVSHGNALSVYFRDPEGNRIELLIDTPWHVPQPHRMPVDLELPDEELWAAVERDARARPGFMPRAQWAAEIARAIAQAEVRRDHAPERA